MKKNQGIFIIKWLIAIILLASPTLTAAGGPHDPTQVHVAFSFDQLYQGETGLITISGEGVKAVQGYFNGRHLPFYQTDDRRLVGIIAMAVDEPAGVYPLEIFVETFAGIKRAYGFQIEFVEEVWLETQLQIPESLNYLLDPEVNEKEYERLFQIYNNFTARRYWSGPFVRPVDGTLLDGFGSDRIYNGGLLKLNHTGVDLRAPTGTQIKAAAAGKIVLAEPLDIHGHMIIIDHGWGVYTGYAHLSKMNFKVGDIVEKGVIIGESGSSGRSQGPHLHWEVVVNGVRVDPISWLELEAP